MEPSGLVQEKPAEVGWIYLQASMQQQDSKRVASVAELSLQVSEESEPEQSRLRSKTVLKSPQRSVGMEGSTSSASCSRNWFLPGLRLGAYNEITQMDWSQKENSHCNKTPFLICPRLDQRQSGTKEDNTTTRFLGARRNNTWKTRRTKPQITFSQRNTVRFLDTDNINDNR